MSAIRRRSASRPTRAGCVGHFGRVLSRRLLSLRRDAAVSVWKEGRPLAALRWPALRYTQPAPLERTMAVQLFADRESHRVDVGERRYAIADDTADGRFAITVCDVQGVGAGH